MFPRRVPEAQPAPTLARPPEPIHAMPQQHGPGQLHEGLGDVEIAQRADLEEGDAEPLRVGPGLLRGDLPLEGQVQAVSHQDFGNSGSVLQGERQRRGYGRELCCWHHARAGVTSGPWQFTATRDPCVCPR